MIRIIDAIMAINSTVEVVVRGTDIDTCEIEWLNGTAEISKADIKTKMDELQSAYDDEQWKRNRQSEYPDAIECVHALLDGGDTLTDLQAKRTAIKNKYPKE